MSKYYLRQNNYLGDKSTKKLNNSKVLIVGIGGLGSGVAQILSRMGVGKLILVDNDIIQEHNLSRQQLYTFKDIDKSKVFSAKKHLLKINPNIKIQAFQAFADETFLNQFEDINLVIDCTDRHSSRREIDKFAIKNNVSWVHGAAIREEGVVCVFNPKKGPLKSYEDIYKNKNDEDFCESIIATTTNLISSLQASLAIKVLLNQKIPNSLLRINLDSWSFDKLKTK